VSGDRSAWLRRQAGNDFTAFAINCTHLGCPVRWEGNADLFMCPCHGGVYYSNGDVAGGPPPRPLHRYPVRITDGQVEIQVGTVLTEG
jgi:menaquinol-cytochrome c reductase iron-sulfur subunit